MHPWMIKKNIFYEKNAPQARFFMTKNALQARLIKQNAPQAGFFDKVHMGTLSCQCSKKMIYHESQIRIFFF